MLLRLGDLRSIVPAAAFLVTATLLFVLAFELARGIVIPNILLSTRGVFIVLLSAVASHRKSTALDEQGKSIYLLRLAASVLIVFSIWLTLK